MKKEVGLGILVIALVFGMTVVGCDNGSTNGNGEKPDVDGTWNRGDFSLAFDGSNWTYLQNNINMAKGTFSISGLTSGSVTINTTHTYSGGSWFPYSWSGNGKWNLSGNTLTFSEFSVGSEHMNGDWIKQLE